MLEIVGKNARALGAFAIEEPRFTVGRLINPDSRDNDPTRFLSLFGNDAVLVAKATDVTLVVRKLQSDYPDVELQLDVELENDPEIDVDELVAFVQRTTGLDLDILPDGEFTLNIFEKQPSVTRR